MTVPGLDRRRVPAPKARFAQVLTRSLMVVRTAWPILLALTAGLAWAPSLATALLVKPALAQFAPGASGVVVGLVRTLIWRVFHSLYATTVTAVALSRLAAEPRIDPRQAFAQAIRATPIVLAYSLAVGWGAMIKPWIGPLPDGANPTPTIAINLAIILTPFVAALLFAFLTPAAVAETEAPGRLIAGALAAIRGFRLPILIVFLLLRVAETQVTSLFQPILFAAVRPELGSPSLALVLTVASFPARAINLAWILFIAAAYFSQVEIQSHARPSQVAEVFD